MNRNFTFEDFKQELEEELAPAREAECELLQAPMMKCKSALEQAAMLEQWVLNMGTYMNVDTPFSEAAAELPCEEKKPVEKKKFNVLSGADETSIEKYSQMGRESGSNTLLHAANVLRLCEEQLGEMNLPSAPKKLRLAEIVRSIYGEDDIIDNTSYCGTEDEENQPVCMEEISEVDIAACGEWIQEHQTAIRNRMKANLEAFQGTEYDLDDLVQEANLAIFRAWTKFNPDSGVTRDNFCWHTVYNRMLHLRRTVAAQKKGSAVTETINAVALAHAGPENMWLDGTMTWTSLADTSEYWPEDIATTIADLNVAMAAISEEIMDILALIAEGYTQTEISEAMCWNQSQVSCKINSGRKNLKAAIA